MAAVVRAAVAAIVVLSGGPKTGNARSAAELRTHTSVGIMRETPAVEDQMGVGTRGLQIRSPGSIPKSSRMQRPQVVKQEATIEEARWCWGKRE